MSDDKSHLPPRKRPVQARATQTVDAIVEACIDVLLSQGIEGLTTTRVAIAAGVSVGSLYQWFPNKQALLEGALASHLDALVATMEAACTGVAGHPLEQVVLAIVDAWLAPRLARARVSRALLAVALEPAWQPLAARMGQRLQLAMGDALVSASDARFADPTLVSFMLAGALGGQVQALLAAGMPEPLAGQVREQMALLALSYLRAAALP
jgi:AcrR family transcriptional regulator